MENLHVVHNRNMYEEFAELRGHDLYIFMQIFLGLG